jgi:hypothetical protein
MLFNIRTNLDLYYRLIFVGLFLLFGLSALGIVMLEDYAGISIIPLESEIEKQALLSILSVMGVLGTCTGLLILYFMREKRRADRRQRSSTITFPERRIIINDRRKSSL